MIAPHLSFEIKKEKKKKKGEGGGEEIYCFFFFLSSKTNKVFIYLFYSYWLQRGSAFCTCLNLEPKKIHLPYAFYCIYRYYVFSLSTSCGVVEVQCMRKGQTKRTQDSRPSFRIRWWRIEGRIRRLEIHGDRIENLRQWGQKTRDLCQQQLELRFFLFWSSC